jgi:hypothetical protein
MQPASRGHRAASSCPLAVSDSSTVDCGQGEERLDSAPRIVRGADGAYWIRRGLQSARVGHDFKEARRSLREIRATYARKGRHAVYLIEGVPGWLKIGRAASPELRLQNLSKASPFSLRLAHVVWCQSMDEAAELEDRLLGRFGAIRGNGEWVKDLPEVRGAFTTLAARCS